MCENYQQEWFPRKKDNNNNIIVLLFDEWICQSIRLPFAFNLYVLFSILLYIKQSVRINIDERGFYYITIILMKK